ncbi:LysR substrate-binding domain-containing protein [Mesorhizobium sp. MSK_1335]|uniref:LysR substrate-binding domain-containing protein n=1 Tax=Mesorhizobium montanum TaxID=3072323 RepID=A0ABU4ZW50_9HYPH|nr:LysR substrate-binding domain-containing protein [Mesorhizobium sp. MSK_1335]MDX8529255.1 LysR substrate-binding domain-containing protein [Mesorhizobium sp. MSK_1335]
MDARNRNHGLKADCKLVGLQLSVRQAITSKRFFTGLRIVVSLSFPLSMIKECLRTIVVSVPEMSKTEMAEHLRHHRHSVRNKAVFRNLQRLLPAFESAARLKSFTLAGEEIGLSQSSVSKQIIELESRLGQRLFIRLHKRIALTSAGDRLFKTYSIAISRVLDVVEDLIHERSREQIVLSTTTGIGAFMLLPRLAEMRQCFFGHQIFLMTWDPRGIEPAGQFDLALIYGDPDVRGIATRALFTDVVTPVCTPEFLAKNGPLREVRDLLDCELLYTQAQVPSWVNWRQWLREFDLELPKNYQPIGFNSDYNTIQACLAGEGIALGWLRGLSSVMESGRLVTPLSQYLPTEERYQLAWPADKPPEFSIEPFYEWLVRRYGGTLPFYPPTNLA